jgi:hypothetical protein
LIHVYTKFVSSADRDKKQPERVRKRSSFETDVLKKRIVNVYYFEELKTYSSKDHSYASQKNSSTTRESEPKAYGTRGCGFIRNLNDSP